MNRIQQIQLEELERSILTLGEYDKLEITNKGGRIEVIKKSTAKLVIIV